MGTGMTAKLRFKEAGLIFDKDPHQVGRRDGSPLHPATPLRLGAPLRLSASCIWTRCASVPRACMGAPLSVPTCVDMCLCAWVGEGGGGSDCSC